MRVAMLRPDVKVPFKFNASRGEVITWANQEHVFLRCMQYATHVMHASNYISRDGKHII